MGDITQDKCSRASESKIIIEKVTTVEVRDIIEKIITNAFKKVQNAYDCHKEQAEKQKPVSYDDTAIVFPMYGEHRNPKNKTRISEQELRFAFVEAFNEENKDKKYYYSVETPTNSKYLVKGENTPRIIPQNKKGGKSGQFDLVIHDSNMNRICLIEFKAGSPSEKEIKKDLLKLANHDEDIDDTNPLLYFIHLVENDLTSNDRLNLQNARDWLPMAQGLTNYRCNVIFRCYSLKKKKELNG